MALEEFSVLFLYSCILMSLLQVKIKKNSSGDFGFFKKLSSHSRINSSSSITTSKQLFRRKVLASLKVDIFVCERNIAVAVPSENCLLLSIFFLAGTTGLDLVFLIHPRRRPGSQSSYLKVPNEESMLEGNKVNAYFYRKTKYQKRDQKVFFKESAPRLETRLKEALKQKRAIKWSLVYHCEMSMPDKYRSEPMQLW